MDSKRKRAPITLLEIMIVILLIGIIGGVLSYNLKGTLDRGKAFRTEEGIKRLKEILEMEIEQGFYTVEDFTRPGGYDKVRECVRRSGFIPESEVNKFLEDGWKEPYTFTQSRRRNNGISVKSQRFDQYKKAHPKPK